MNLMTAEEIEIAIRAGFGERALIRTRRAGQIYQIQLPAFFSDGDGVNIFVRPSDDGRLRMTDLGQTAMRLSYTRDLNASAAQAMERLAAVHGFDYSNGEITATILLKEIFPAALGLAQIESEAEATIESAAKRGMRSEQFHQVVKEALIEIFGDRCQLNYHDETDPYAKYSVDAMITGPVWLGVAVVPSDVEAERAVGSKLWLEPKITARHRWIAIPRNIEQLSAKTRGRLLNEFLTPVTAFENGRDSLPGKLKDLAA
jgi:hypothetical protein